MRSDVFTTSLWCLAALLTLGAAQQLENLPEECSSQLTQTIPVGQIYNGSDYSISNPETYETFLDLINNAKKTIQISSFYMTLIPTCEDQASHPSARPGRLVHEALISAARDRGVSVEIIAGMHWSEMSEVKAITDSGINYTILNTGTYEPGSCHHAKFIITDDSNFYLGSANLDWRSLAHVQELGIVFKNCGVLARDLQKIFSSYKLVAELGRVPEEFPESFKTEINIETPHWLNVRNRTTGVFLSAAPPSLQGPNNKRTADLDAILSIIRDAKSFVYISVMNYSPLNGFGWEQRYWPVIENELKAAYIDRKVRVKLLVSHKSFNPRELASYRSLAAFSKVFSRYGDLAVKYKKVPTTDSFQSSLPYSRIHHDKYIVTDKAALITTSNMSPSYYLKSTGVSIVMQPGDGTGKSIVDQLSAIFMRDFRSSMAHTFDEIIE